jgi:Zn-dependent protease with chaperone function
MDFFQQQAKAHKKTKWLVIYFILAVATMIAVIYVVAILAFSGVKAHQQGFNGEQQQFNLWDPQIFFCVALGMLAVILLGSSYKTMALAAGGSAVSEMMGGRLIKPNTTDPDERKLLNVVEEMAIASGVPVPQVYVMDEENGINAFAAGHKPGDATVTVTRGCMKLLTRDELQGVIGHEFSHILNGDMRLNLRLMGTIFGILCLAIIGRILLQTARGGGRNRGQNPLPILGLALLVVGYIGVFFGRLIQAAVSRQREFLADASSVQFTRNPGGITGALKKIGGLGEDGSRVSHAHSEELSHMFFGNGVSHPFIGLLETHPPLPERIRVFEPTFDGKFPIVRYDQGSQSPRMPQAKRQQMPNIFGTVVGGAILASGDAAKPPVINPHAVLPNLGNPTPLHLEYAAKLRESLPDSVKAAAQEPLDAVALIYAMLLNDDDAKRATQLAELAKRVEPAIYQKTAALFPDVSKAEAHAHLPMVNLALGALRHLTTEQYTRFSQTLQWLITSDGKVELFEFTLQKIIVHHLGPQFGQGGQRAIIQYYSIKPLLADCGVLLSALANVGSNDAAEIQKAFDTGAPYLRAPDGDGLSLLPREQCGLDKVDAALNRMAQASPLIKKNLLEACIHTVGADGVILEGEAELLRAFADTLDCPMPPFVTA